MTYKVGDTVVIRPDIYDDEQYEEIFVVEAMEAYHGMEATITDMHQNGRTTVYSIDLDDGAWSWSGSMFCGTKEEYESRNDWDKPFTIDMLSSLPKNREVCVSVKSAADAEMLFAALAERQYHWVSDTDTATPEYTRWDCDGENTVYWLTRTTVDRSDDDIALEDEYDYVIKYTFQAVRPDDINITMDGLILF